MSELLDNNTIHELIEKITSLGQEASIQSFNTLNDELFTLYCSKEYLKACEPEYCSFRYLATCKYIAALEELSEKYAINVINKTCGKQNNEK